METVDPAIARRRDLVYLAVSDRLRGLGDPIHSVTIRYGGEFGDRLFSAGGVPLVEVGGARLVGEPGLSVVFSLALHGHDVFVTITEGPIEDVANVLCDLDAYSSSIVRLGARATFAPDNERLLAAGYEGVLVVNLGFWKPFEGVDPDLVLGDGECLHLRGCFFLTPEERATRLAGGFDALWDRFARTGKDPYAWPAAASCDLDP